MYIYIIYLMVTDDLVTRVTFLLNGCDALKNMEGMVLFFLTISNVGF